MPRQIHYVDSKTVFPGSFPVFEEYIATLFPLLWMDEPWRLLEAGILQQIAKHLEARGLGRIKRQGSGHVFIGRNAKVHRKATIRGWVIACEGVEIGPAEIKNALLLPRAKAKHWCIVSDSIVGSDVNVSAGVVLANMREDKAPVRFGWKGELIDTQQTKFGALVGDRSFIGVGAILSPGTVLGEACSVQPATSLGHTWPPRSKIGALPLTPLSPHARTGRSRIPDDHHL